MEIVRINSSNGWLRIDGDTGEVLECDIFPDGDMILAKIRLFDLEEWRDYYGKKQLPAVVDILDLGYWQGGTMEGAFNLQGMGFKGGRYEQPCFDWRETMINDGELDIGRCFY